MVSGLAQALGENEGDADGTEAPDGAACDAVLPPEDFAHPSVEAEIGGRSLAEIAEEACRLTGVAPEPGLFEARDEAAAAVALPGAVHPPTAAGAAKVEGGGVASPVPDAGAGLPPEPPQQSGHDPPSG